MSLFYMSFCDPDLPKGSQFLGVTIVRAETLEWALTVSHMTGCNPGGEVMSLGPIPDEAVKPEYIGRLLTADEAQAAGA